MQQLLTLTLAYLISGSTQVMATSPPTYNSTTLVTLETSQFNPTMEGASVNYKGEIFATSYGSDKKLFRVGKVSPQQEEFFSHPDQTTFLNGMRFINKKTALTIDVVNHRVIKLNLDPNTGNVISDSVLCQDNGMLQPNDIAVTNNGVAYLSGMKFVENGVGKEGDVWVCKPNGQAQKLDTLGRTNGIEVGVGSDYLYVSESVDKNWAPSSQKIWKYKINDDYTVSNKQLFADFGQLDGTGNIDIDGMRFDVVGNLYVTRAGGKKVTVLDPQGKIKYYINLSFSAPTNLEFGGADGKTLYIVGRCGIDTPWGTGKGCVDTYKVENSGRAFHFLQNNGYYFKY
jgi:sugar lactone lactonase YvrE